ncbi:hypothetical protein [Streptomyces klenkii]|uniref:hypothetical protein n=1 Tax=Streptomyces klenkii TaxID=1420899 RepID=UPI0034468C3E
MFNDPIWTVFSTRTQELMTRLKQTREEDRGGLSIEAMILVGALVAVAAVAVTVLMLKVNEKKDQIK